LQRGNFYSKNNKTDSDNSAVHRLIDLIALIIRRGFFPVQILGNAIVRAILQKRRRAEIATRWKFASAHFDSQWTAKNNR